MARFTTPWSHTSKSWTLSKGENHYKDVQIGTSGFKQFKLLLWKNYIIQKRHKLQTVTEILLPLLFTIVLVVVRVLVESDHILDPIIYPSVDLENNPSAVAQSRCNEIYYTPKNPTTDDLIEKVKNDYFRYRRKLENYTFTGFDTEEELVKSYLVSVEDNAGNNHTSTDYESTSPVLAGIIFKNAFPDGKFPKKIEYALRFPATQRSSFDIISERFGIKPAWFTEITYPFVQLLGPRSKYQANGGLPGYHAEGFLYIQLSLDRTLTRMFLNESTPENSTLNIDSYNTVNIKVQRFPYPGYIDDKFIFALQGWLPAMMMLSFIYPIINIAKQIVHEKERRLKESMKIMGLPNWLHWTAWFIKTFVFLFASSVIITLLMKAKFTEAQDLAILSYMDGYVLLLIFTVYTISIICMAFFVSTLFSHANAGATAAGVLYFVLYIPYGFLQPQYNLLSRTTKVSSCFMTNCAIAFACQIICMFEGTGAGLQWSTLFQGAGPDDEFCMVDCLMMMTINSAVYFLLAIYIEAVWPGEFGVPLPWYFPFTKWYWTGGLRDASYSHSTGLPDVTQGIALSDLFEPDPKDLFPGIQIKGLTKSFKNKVAVNKMNLNMYENQVTALLGHNGAGKTTTMSMLTGMYTPTSGTALLNNYDICKDIKAVRSSLGLCPQHDILFDELTVEEHLKFFCLLKGLHEDIVEFEVARMIKAIGLENKRKAEAHTLSGGMKRKLSVGIALCGGSKVVLLDEPTSGMDVGARRSTWDLIQSEKNGRTIVLSTHFMEEADLLGDRIAIMADGELQCVGSSLFLKKKYGGGYHLVIVTEPGCVVENITDILKKTIPDVEIAHHVGAELSYSLPDKKSHLFPAMFHELESRREELMISSYGASITTMEEVFIRVGREADAKIAARHESTKSPVDKKQLTINIEDPKTMEQIHKEESMRNSGMTLLFQQFWAMLVKKSIYASRNRVLLTIQLAAPFVYLNIVLLLLSLLPGLVDPPPHYLTLDRYEKLGQTVTTMHCSNASSETCVNYDKYLTPKYLVDNVPENESFIDHILVEGAKDIVNVNFRYIVGMEERAAKIRKYSNTSKIKPSPFKTDLVAFFNNQPLHSPPLSLNFVSNAMMMPTNHTVHVINHPFPYSSLDSLKTQGTVYTIGFQIGFNVAFGMSFLAASFVVFLIQERESRSKHLQFVSGVEYPVYWAASFIIDFINYIIPCFAIIATLNVYTIEDFNDYKIQFYVFVLLIGYGLAVIPLMYLWSYAFTIPASGYTRLAIYNLFTGMSTMLIIAMLQVPEFGFEKVASGLNKFFLFFPNYALGMGLVQISTNFQLKKHCATVNLEFLCPAFPDSFCCSKLKEDYLDWEPSGIGMNISYLFMSFALYFGILFIYESRILRKIAGCFRRNKEVAADLSESEVDDGLQDDEDVQVENDKIRKTNLSTLYKTNNLILRDLTKYYKKLLAVDHLNLAVKRGECFGLLGVNGAGKTTTFKMLTGDIGVSKGDAYIYENSIKTELKKAHQNLGYCPQFDGIIEEMTGRETIRMFARLRGIHEKFIDRLVDRLAKTLIFTEHIEKRVGAYSGGNKRKLSTALSLVGNPPLVFLDEPTTGMDPVARRHMWDAISVVRDSGTSIVLTSHSMEECEALCSRLAIMVNGRFRCLGSPQHLKNKFGEGYTLVAQMTPKSLDADDPFTRDKQISGRRRSSSNMLRKTKSPQRWEAELEDLRKFIEESFPGCILKDIHPGFVHYHIKGGEVAWGKMFEKMEIAKDKFKLDAYSVGQTSLEQVFLNFTKTQVNLETPEKKIHFVQDILCLGSLFSC